LALIVDDPPETSRTLLAALDIVHRAGFAQVKFVAPTHPATTSWFKLLPKDSVITLPVFGDTRRGSVDCVGNHGAPSRDYHRHHGPNMRLNVLNFAGTHPTWIKKIELHLRARVDFFNSPLADLFSIPCRGCRP
jgi:hypothetical protein